MIDWVNPWALLLLPLPALFLWLMPASSRGSSLLIPQRTGQLIESLRGPFDLSSVVSTLRWGAIALGWICLVLVLANPLTSREPLKGASGRDLLMVLDMSASMLAKDVLLDGLPVARIDAVKAIAGAFINRREGDRVGMVVFADRPFLIAPLTYDVVAVDAYLAEVDAGLAGRKTAIGDAIALAVKQLTNRPAESRVMLLLSDGENNTGSLHPDQAIRLASRHKIKIHTIGFGDDPNNEGQSSAELLKIANQTGGQHFTAKSTNGLTDVYAELDRIEPTVSLQNQRYVERTWTTELMGFVLLSWLLVALIDWRQDRL